MNRNKIILFIAATLIISFCTLGCQQSQLVKPKKTYDIGDTLAFEITKDSFIQYTELVLANDTMMFFEISIDKMDPHWTTSGDGLSCVICNHQSKYSKEKYTNSKGEEFDMKKFIKCEFPDIVDTFGFEIVLKVEENNKFAILESMIDPTENDFPLKFIYKTEMPFVKTRPKDDFDDE